MNQNVKNVNVRQKKRKNKTTKTGTKNEKLIVLYEKTFRDDKLTSKKMKTRQGKKRSTRIIESNKRRFNRKTTPK